MFGDPSVPRPSSVGWHHIKVSWLDLVWAVLAVPLAIYIRSPEYFSEARLDGSLLYIAIGIACSAGVLIPFGLGRALSRFFALRDALRVVAASVTVAAVTAVTHFSFVRLDDMPRSLPLLHAVVLATGLLMGRVIARQRANRRARQGAVLDEVENVLLIGTSRLAWFYVRTVDEIAPRSRNVIGIVDRRRRFVGRSLAGRHVIGVADDLSRIVDEYAVHGVTIHRFVVTEPMAKLSVAAQVQIAALARDRRIEVQQLDELLVLPRPQIAPQVAMVGTPLVVARRAAIARRPYWRLKRAMDIVCATMMLLLLAPVGLLLVPIVLLDVGLPLLFWQRRIGRNATPISVFKFRTLRQPLDRHGNRLPDDKRLSHVGRIVRASRLDEIPQLLSILRGDMSLIGPRPLLPIDQPEAVGLRLMVRPGLTGWAQVNGGRLVTIEEKNALDEWYVRHASLLIDLAILIRTPLMMVTGDRRGERAIATALREQDSWRTQTADAAATMEAATLTLPDSERMRPTTVSATSTDNALSDPFVLRDRYGALS